MADFSHTIPKVVHWLDRHPDGVDATDMAAGLGLSYSHVAGAVGQACDQGLARWVHAPFGKANNRRVYFAPRHCPAVWGEASRKSAQQKKPAMTWKEKAKARMDAKSSEAQKASGFSSVSRVVVTEAPKFVDRRFEPTGEIPRVVDSSQARPWAVAATGGANAAG